MLDHPIVARGSCHVIRGLKRSNLAAAPPLGSLADATPDAAGIDLNELAFGSKLKHIGPVKLVEIVVGVMRFQVE